MIVIYSCHDMLIAQAKRLENFFDSKPMYQGNRLARFTLSLSIRPGDVFTTLYFLLNLNSKQ
jgi:hypothetical protein